MQQIPWKGSYQLICGVLWRFQSLWEGQSSQEEETSEGRIYQEGHWAYLHPLTEHCHLQLTRRVTFLYFVEPLSKEEDAATVDSWGESMKEGALSHSGHLF